MKYKAVDWLNPGSPFFPTPLKKKTCLDAADGSLRAHCEEYNQKFQQEVPVSNFHSPKNFMTKLVSGDVHSRAYIGETIDCDTKFRHMLRQLTIKLASTANGRDAKANMEGESTESAQRNGGSAEETLLVPGVQNSNREIRCDDNCCFFCERETKVCMGPS